MTAAAPDDLPRQDEGEAGPYALIVVLRAKPESADALEARLLEQVPRTRAEPGNVLYTLNRDRQDRNAFYFYEAYRDLDAFRKHLSSKPVAALGRELGDYLAEDLKMIYLSVPSSSF